MNELFEKNQTIRAVPSNIENSVKGKIVDVLNHSFVMELDNEPSGLEVKKVIEFYSQTKNGTLYFSSAIAKIDGNKLVVLLPKKHRFLQRRAFPRIRYSSPCKLRTLENIAYVASIDVSAGGIKFKSQIPVSLDEVYDMELDLPDEKAVKCKFEPIKIEKDNGLYFIAGRFVDLAPEDKMFIVSFSMRKRMEDNEE